MREDEQAVTIPLQGGLGNQLFQLAAGLLLRRRHDIAVRFTDDWLRTAAAHETPRAFALGGLLEDGELTSTPVRRQDPIGRRLLGRRIDEAGWHDDALARVGGRTRVVTGYFQRLDYAEGAWPLVQDRLATSSQHGHRALLEPPGERYGALHVRLGDYVSNERAKAHHGVTAPNYFADLVAESAAQHGITRWRLVSDEPDKALALVAGVGSTSGLSLSADDSADEWDDLRTLSAASVAILSNSSFSWWGAFVGRQQHPIAVIAPRPWLADPRAEPPLFPVDWERRERPLA